MATHAGVWIDHKRAVVILGTDAGQAVTKIAFDIGQPVRTIGGARSRHSYTPNDFVAEDKLQRKVENDRKDYYDDVIASLRGAAALLILGPGEAKRELCERIKRKKFRGLSVELEATDKMTDRQLAAKVRNHFAKLSAGKSAAPKKSVKAVRGKRTKKSRK